MLQKLRPQPLGFFVLQFRRRFQFVSLRHPFSKTRVPCVGVCVPVIDKRTSTTREQHEEVSKINEMPLFMRTHEYKPPRHGLALAAYTLEREVLTRWWVCWKSMETAKPFHRRRRMTQLSTSRFLLSGVTQVTFRKVSMLICYQFRSSFKDMFQPKHCADLLPVTPSFLSGIRRSDGLFHREELMGQRGQRPSIVFSDNCRRNWSVEDLRQISLIRSVEAIPVTCTRFKGRKRSWTSHKYGTCSSRRWNTNVCVATKYERVLWSASPRRCSWRHSWGRMWPTRFEARPACLCPLS